MTALIDLAREGVLAHDYSVPCRIIGNGAVDNELSLAENVVRVAMHPADQVQAFGALADAGATVAGIAARFGVAERTVEQRLRLGNAAPELLGAYRADEIDLDTLKAFAVTADRERQMAVWEQVKEQSYRPSGWQIKRMLTEDRVPATSITAHFVGVETYEAAGGRVDRDLFADEDERGVWLEHPDLLDKLATKSLQVTADELATRWKWAEARLDVDWSDLARFGRINPQPAQPTGEEKAESERLRTRNDELAEMDDDAWTEKLVAEADAIETRLEEIEAAVEARATFRHEDFAIAGCIATIGRDGKLQVVQGLVRPEDMPAQEPGDANAAGQVDDGGDEAGIPGIQAPTVSAPAMPPARSDAEAEARKEAGVGIGLGDDLRAIRTALVKVHLAKDFAATFDLMLFQMGRAAMLADRSSLPFDWLTMEDDGEAFAALRALPEAGKQSLFAACAARTVKGQLAFEHGARPELEATVARLGIDFAAHVRPSAELFWSRLRKDRMLAIARDTLGVEWASAHRKDKKATLAAAMESAFAAGGVPVGVTAEGRAAASTWAPPGFHAFDRGRIDDGEDGAAASDPAPADPPATDTPEETAVDPANSTDDAASADTTSTEADPAPDDSPQHTSVVESIDSPAVAERLALARARQDEVDAVNAVSTADGGPRVIVRAEGLGGDGTGEAPPNADPPLPPVRGNAHDSDGLEILAFLRRG